MAKGFNLTAQINLKGPNNLKPIVADIKRELGTIQANVSVKLDSKSAKSVNDITRRLSAMNSVLVQSKQHANDLKNTFRDLSAALGSFQSTNQSTSRTVQQVGKNFQATAKNIQVARTEMEEFGRQTFLAVKRFAAFSLPTTGIFAFVNAINSGIKAFIDFDKELIKLQQVTGKGSAGISGLEQEITRLATSLGVSSESLLTVASTLAQAGLSAEETRIALAALAKTELAPSFDDLKSTTEGAIAALRQFSLGAGDLEAALGSINAVAAAFAVESADIITAIQRTGGVFAAASKGVTQGKDALNEFIAVFTSVRATTRESAETIATGLRTIFTRIQRAGTIKQLKEFGVNLQDLEGKFVGPFEAVKRLSEALNQLDPRDVRFSTIVEELGGFRQIGKVIPLIQQFATAQQALGVAQKGAGSLAEAQKKAQESLANQIAKVREQFLALVRDIGKSTVFKGLFTIITGLTSGLIGLAGAFKPILPLLGIFAAVKGVKAIAEIGSGFFGGMKKGGGARAVGSNIGETLSGAKEKEASDVKNRATVAISENTNALKTLTTAVNSLTSAMNSRGPSKLKDGGKILGFNNGGMVPGNGGGDTVPAFLEGGEIVMNRKAVKKYGAGNLLRMNSNKTKGFAIGGATWNDAVGTDFKIDKKSGARITDGDTIAAKVFTVKEYRLDAVDAAETNPLQKYGKEATSVLARYQDNLLDTITSGKGGAYGRGKFRQDQAASEIVERGYGIPDFRYGGQRFQNQLDFARKKGKGIWNSSNYNHPKRILFEADNKQDIAKEIALGRGIQPQTRFSSGGPIQKFMAGSPGGINVPSGKGRGKKVKKGARGKFEHLNQSQIESLSTEEMIDYAKRQMYHIMTTGGSGISLGEEFVEVPRSRIDPELEKDLITLPDGRRGFYREKIAPFGSEQVAKSKKSEQQQRREKFFRTSRDLLTAAMQGIIAPGSALPKAQQDAISPFLEMVTGDYSLGLSATPRLKSEEAPVASASSALLASIKDPLSEFRKSGGQTSLAGVIPVSAAEKIKAAIPAYIESLKKENETQKVGKAQTALKYFDDFINGGTAAKPAHATHFAETVNQILKGGLVQGFAEGGSPTPQQLVGGPFHKGRISSQGETWSQILTKRAGELGLAIDSGSLVIGGRTISLSKALTPAQLRAGTIVGKAVGNNETTIKALASLRENIVKEYLSGRQEVDEADPFNLTEEEKRLARSIAVVGIASDYKAASRQVYKKVGGVPFSVSIGSLSGAKSEEVLAKLRTKDFVNLQEAASELLPDRPLVNLTDQDLNRLGRPNAEGYQLEAILALLGATGGEYNERNRAVDFEGGLPPDLAALFGVPSGVFTQAKRTLNSDNVGHAIEGIAARLSGVRMAFGGQVNGPGFEEIKQQIIDKYPEIQFRISKRKRAWGYNLMGALKSEGGLSSGNNRFNFEQPGNLKQLQEYADKLASELMSPEQLAMGGLISNFASGGTIPAMVSNGEAFIPPSQAKKIGYAKLNKMNQADRNRMSGFAVGGGVFKGPGSGTSDSIGPVDLPVGGYVIRKKAVDALTSKFNSGGYVGDAKTFAAGGSVIPKNIARKAEIEKETVRLKGLEEKRGSVSGIEKNILENEISRTADKIKQLEAEIEGAIQGFDDATNRVTETNQALYNANQTLVDSVKAKYEAVNKGKKWEDLSLKQQDKLVKESRTGRYRGMFAAENKAIDVAEQRADKARRRKEKGYDGVTSAEQVREAGLTPQEIANREQADQAMIAYRAKQAGVSEKGYKYQLAQQLGKKAYEAKDLYAGRVEEMKTGLITKQETLQNIRQQKNQAQNIIKKGSAAGATEADKAAAAAASTQLADANTRLAMETENIFQQMRQVNPTLPLKDVQDAAAKVAEQLSQGDIKGAQEEMVKTMGKIPEDAEAMQIAMQQLARELNIDVKQLERTFQGGAESKLLQRQQFAQSREGQRFGALSEFAPDTAKLLSKIPGLGSAADFISGKGGKYSKAFANMGGIQGLGAGVAVGAEALKNFMPEGSLRDPNTAGIFGAVSGAGAMGAGGAQLGMMVAGPVGALIGGIGGAIIGGIQGFWDAQNATILQNSLDALAESSGNVDKAFQVLDAQFNKANFKEVEIAIGKQIESQASVEKIAMAGPSFLGPNAEQRKEAAAASSAAAISTTKNLTRLVESNLSKTSLADLQKTRINLEAGRGENPILAQAKSIAKMQGLNEAEAARTASINAAVAQLKESGVQEEQITKLKRESSDELAKTGEKLLNTQALLIARQQELNRIMHEVAKATESMMDALASLQGRIQRFGDGINDILTESENIANPNEIRRVKRTSGERILSNTAGYSRDEIQGAIDSIVQRMGGGTEAISLGKQVSAGEDLRKVLPALLRQSGASTDTTKITDAATSILQRSGLDRNDPLITSIISELGKKLEGAKGEGGQGLGLLADEIEKVGLGGFSKVLDSAKESLIDFDRKTNDAFDALTKVQNQWVDAMMRSIDYSNRATQVELQGALELQKALGQSVSLEEMNKPFETEVKGLTGGTLDPVAINRGIIESREKLRQLENERASLAIQPESERREKALAANDESTRKYKLSIDKADKALKMLAENGSTAANALQKLSENQGRAKAFSNTLSDIVFDSQKRMDLAPKLAAFVTGQKALQQGDNRLFGNEVFGKQYLGGIDFLGQLGVKDEKLTQLRNQATIEGLKAQGQGALLQLVIPGAEKLFGQGNDTIEEILNFASNPENDPLVQAVKDAYKAQQAALDALSASAADIANNLKSSGIDPIIKELSTALPNLIKKAYDEAKANLAAATKEAAAAAATTPTAETPSAPRQSLVQRYAGNYTTQPTPREQRAIERGRASGYKSGGLIYASAGQYVNFEPRGTDTVAAMLTPGEFVVNAQSTAENLNLLEAINSGKSIEASYMNDGGRVSNYDRAQQARANYKAAQKAKLQAYNQEMQRRREAYKTNQKTKQDKLGITPEQSKTALSPQEKTDAANRRAQKWRTYGTDVQQEKERLESYKLEDSIVSSQPIEYSDIVPTEEEKPAGSMESMGSMSLSSFLLAERINKLYGEVPPTVDRADADLAKTRALRESIELREEMDRLAQEKNYNDAADMAGKQAAERSKVAASQQQKEQDRIKADQRLGIARGELNNLTQRLGREPTDQEIMDEFRIPEEQVKSFRDSVANVQENPGRARVRRLQALFAERLLSDPKYIKYQNLQSQGFQSFVNSKIEQLYGASLEDPGSDKKKYPYKDEADIDGLFPRVELDFYNRQDKFKDMERDSKSKIVKQVWDEYNAGKFNLEEGAGFAPDSMAAKAAKFAGGAGRYTQDLTRGTVGAGINVAAGTIGMGLSGLGLLGSDILKGAGLISEEQSNFNRELLSGFGNRSQQLFGVAGSDAFRLAEQTGRGLAGESLLRTESAGEAFDRKNREETTGTLIDTPLGPIPNSALTSIAQIGRDVAIDAMVPTPGPKGPKTVGSNVVDIGLDVGKRVDQADNARIAVLRARRDIEDIADLTNREAAAKLRKATPQPLAADSPQARFINEKEAVKQIAAKQPVHSARKQAATAQTQTQSSIPKGSGRPTTRFELTEDTPKFRIQGVDVNGKEIVKVIQAASEDAALRAAKQEGIYSYSVTGLAKHKNNPKIPTRLNRGGIVYASNGTLVPYQPRGSDTVPAMLTPGEFVVNSDATSNNLPLLQHLNKGGMVRYYQQGSTGPVPSSGSASSNSSSSSTAYKVDSSGLDSFLTNFGSYVDKLTKITFPTIPDTITMNGNHVVDVRVSGAAAFEAINENVKNMINTAIDEKMGELWRQSNGQLGSRPVSATAGGSKSTGAIMQ